MTLSKNGVSLALLMLSWAGITISETDVLTLISAVGQIVSILGLIWNQIDRKNTKWLLWKTPEQD